MIVQNHSVGNAFSHLRAGTQGLPVLCLWDRLFAVFELAVAAGVADDEDKILATDSQAGDAFGLHSRIERGPQVARVRFGLRLVGVAVPFPQLELALLMVFGRAGDDEEAFQAAV